MCERVFCGAGPAGSGSFWLRYRGPCQLLCWKVVGNPTCLLVHCFIFQCWFLLIGHVSAQILLLPAVEWKNSFATLLMERTCTRKLAETVHGAHYGRSMYSIIRGLACVLETRKKHRPMHIKANTKPNTKEYWWSWYYYVMSRSCWCWWWSRCAVLGIKMLQETHTNTYHVHVDIKLKLKKAGPGTRLVSLTRVCWTAAGDVFACLL